jgi:hypothetical protein
MVDNIEGKPLCVTLAHGYANLGHATSIGGHSSSSSIMKRFATTTWTICSVYQGSKGNRRQEYDKDVFVMRDAM